MRSTQWRGVLCFGVLWMTSGCITDATTELTSAPTDAISDLTNGTSAAVSDLTAPLSDVTSSTTPGEASLAPARAKKRLHLFTASSYDNLRSDISRGYGEYLVSLATLAGVRSAQFPEFQLDARLVRQDVRRDNPGRRLHSTDRGHCMGGWIRSHPVASRSTGTSPCSASQVNGPVQ